MGAWWRRRWPPFNNIPVELPSAGSAGYPSSIKSDALSQKPEEHKCQRSAFVARAEGTISPVHKLMKKDIDIEELNEMKRKEELRLLMQMLSDPTHVERLESMHPIDGPTRLILIKT